MAWFEKKVDDLKAAIAKEKAKKPDTFGVCMHGETDCVRCASEDFQSQENNTTHWQALEEDDLKRIIYALPSKVVDLMKRHPKKVVVAGGFIRATVAGEHVHDVDVFFQEERGVKSWADDVGLDYELKDKHLYVQPKGDDPGIELIWRYPYEEPYEVPDQFDYTVVKAAIWYEEGDKKKNSNFIGLCHERFYRDIARKMLVYVCDREVERVASVPRLLKYTKYGYSIDPENLAQVVVKTCLSMDLSNGFEGVLKQLTDSYKPTGSGKNWSDMTEPYVKPKPAPKREYEYSGGS